MTTIDLLAVITDARSLRPNTKRNYANAVKQWLDFAGRDPRGWTAAVGQAFYDQLLANGTSAETANNMITSGLAFAFKRAGALYGIPDITPAINRYKPTTDPDDAGVRHALTSPQAKALLAACAGASLAAQRDHAVTVLGLYTGMRRMSLVSVDLSAVAPHDGYVTVRVLLKGGHLHDVPLDARAWALTAAYRARLSLGGPLFPSIPRARATAGAPLGVEVPAGRITEDGLYRALAKRAATAKLRDFHPHIFRHTFATWCRAAKIEDYLIEVVTGHKSNRGLVDRVYTDRAALHADVARRCYEAVTARLT